MNFLLHRHLALAAHGSALSGIGAMLPDLWRMADRRVRCAPPDVARRTLGDTDATTHEVMRGIEHHLEADLWFHDAPVFTDGERATSAALKSAATAAKKLTLFAHPLWEMCLDGALVRKLGAAALRAEVKEGFAAAESALGHAATAHHFAHSEDGDGYRATFEKNLRGIATALADEPWIDAYSRAEGLVRALGGMRRRFALAPFTDDERPRLEAAIATLEPRADQAVELILSRV